MSDYTFINSLRYEKTGPGKGKIYINGDDVFPFYTKDGVVNVEPADVEGYNYVTIRLYVAGPVEIVEAIDESS